MFMVTDTQVMTTVETNTLLYVHRNHSVYFPLGKTAHVANISHRFESHQMRQWQECKTFLLASNSTNQLHVFCAGPDTQMLTKYNWKLSDVVFFPH